MSEFSPAWHALSREAGISAWSIGAGLTALRKADSSELGWYDQALFGLSIGVERLLKLIFVLDSYLESDGRFPSNAELRKFGHSIKSLHDKFKQIEERARRKDRETRIPNVEIMNAIIRTIDGFATSLRYYNLDILSGRMELNKHKNPHQVWFEEVGSIILTSHYTLAQREVDEKQAEEIHKLISEVTFVMATTESNEEIRSVYDMVRHAAVTRSIQKWGTFHAATFVRELVETLYDLESLIHQRGLRDVPFLHEFFVIFLNSDAYLKTRRTFSPI